MILLWIRLPAFTLRSGSPTCVTAILEMFHNFQLAFLCDCAIMGVKLIEKQ